MAAPNLEDSHHTAAVSTEVVTVHTIVTNPFPIGPEHKSMAKTTSTFTYPTTFPTFSYDPVTATAAPRITTTSPLPMSTSTPTMQIHTTANYAVGLRPPFKVSSNNGPWWERPSISCLGWACAFYAAFSCLVMCLLIIHGKLDWKLNLTLDDNSGVTQGQATSDHRLFSESFEMQEMTQRAAALARERAFDHYGAVAELVESSLHTADVEPANRERRRMLDLERRMRRAGMM